MLNLNYKPVEVVDTEGMPNDVWLKYRTTGIGGSDVAAIYEVSGWTTKRALYYAKLGLEKDEAENGYTLDFGHAVEPFVAAWFQKVFDSKYKKWLENKMKIKIQNLTIFKDTMMYRHPLYPFMQANLDYRAQILTEDGKVLNGIFECKTTSYHIGDEKWDDEKVPYEYELQCRHYMSIMNLDFTIIACLWGNNENDYRVRLVKRDLDLEEELIEMERDFWENNVQAKVPPELSREHSDQEMEAFKSYKISDRIKDGTLHEIDTSEKALKDAVSDYYKAVQKLDAAKAHVETIMKEADVAKCKILEGLAARLDDGQEEFKLDDGLGFFIIKNKKVITKRVDSERLKLERPDILTEFLKKGESTRFSVKKVVI